MCKGLTRPTGFLKCFCVTLYWTDITLESQSSFHFCIYTLAGKGKFFCTCTVLFYLSTTQSAHTSPQTFTPMLTPGATWGSRSCPRTLQHTGIKPPILWFFLTWQDTIWFVQLMVNWEVVQMLLILKLDGTVAGLMVWGFHRLYLVSEGKGLTWCFPS